MVFHKVIFPIKELFLVQFINRCDYLFGFSIITHINKQWAQHSAYKYINS